MDFVKNQIQRIQQQLAGLTASQRMLTAALVVIMVMTLLYWGRTAGTAEMTPLLEQSFTQNDLGAIQNAAQTALVALVRDILTVIAVVTVMLYLDWAMTLVVLGGGPLAVIPLRQLGVRLKSLARRTQAEMGSMTSRLTETFSGARLIKTFQGIGYMLDVPEPEAVTA